LQQERPCCWQLGRPLVLSPCGGPWVEELNRRVGPGAGECRLLANRHAGFFAPATARRGSAMANVGGVATATAEQCCSQGCGRTINKTCGWFTHTACWRGRKARLRPDPFTRPRAAIAAVGPCGGPAQRVRGSGRGLHRIDPAGQAGGCLGHPRIQLASHCIWLRGRGGMNQSERVLGVAGQTGRQTNVSKLSRIVRRVSHQGRRCLGAVIMWLETSSHGRRADRAL